KRAASGRTRADYTAEPGAWVRTPLHSSGRSDCLRERGQRIVAPTPKYRDDKLRFRAQLECDACVQQRTLAGAALSIQQPEGCGQKVVHQYPALPLAAEEIRGVRFRERRQSDERLNHGPLPSPRRADPVSRRARSW